MKSQLVGKDPEAGKDRRQEEKGTTKDEMVVWTPTLGDGEGQGSLACCSLWGHKETRLSDRTEVSELGEEIF